MKSVSSPKPGLVDPLTTGAHQDMNLFTFIDSTISLRPYFQQYLHAGLTHKGTPRELFDKARKIGVAAKKPCCVQHMPSITHKGPIFSFAVILGGDWLVLARKGIAFNKRR